MISSYGAMEPPIPTPTETTIIITTRPSSSRVLKTFLNIFRIAHLVLNVVCIIIASQNYGFYDQSGSRIFFLVVTVILMVASFTLLVWHRVAARHAAECIEPNPLHELIYYAIGFALLFIASVAVFTRKEPFIPFFDFNEGMRQAAGIAIANAMLYLGSAIMIWKLPRTN